MGYLKVMCYTAEQVAEALVETRLCVHPDALVTRDVPEQCEPMVDIQSSIGMIARLRIVSPQALASVYSFHSDRALWLSPPALESIGKTEVVSGFEMELETCLDSDLEKLKRSLEKGAGVPYVLTWSEYTEVLRWRLTWFGFLPESVGRVTEMFLSLAPLSPAVDWSAWNRALGQAFPKLKLDHPVHSVCCTWAMQRIIEDIEAFRSAG